MRRTKKPANSAPWRIATLIVGLALIAFLAFGNPPKAPLNYDKIADEVVVLGDLDGGHGSGVIISADGLILTNGHVAVHANEGRVMNVQFHDGHAAMAHVIWISGDGSDPYDIALLKVDGEKPLPFAKISNQPLVTGQAVFAIGNPDFLGWTVTWGHIAALHRNLSRVGLASELIQDDLSIYGGSSGGGLFDTDGNLIGLTNATSPNPVISFAVSRDTIRMLLGGGA